MLTLHTAPLLLPPGAEPLPDGAVLVQGEAVLAVGPRADLSAAHPGARTRAWPGLLTTGLTHARAVPLLETAYHPDPREYDQLGETPLTGEALARLAPDRTRWAGSVRRGLQRLLRQGVTRVAGPVTDPAVRSALARAGVSVVGPLPAPGDGVPSFDPFAGGHDALSGVIPLVPGVRADLAAFDVPDVAALRDGGAAACVATVLAGRLVHRAR
ncbi:imidazolonepropionase-like domain-containing protein [Streptomyces albidoflavus]|uniref:imidazolonepropionase-like domain-containing protein n=1 Tax=Streptomyces albidoflavus TaxID=1886 RepID=UPI0033A48015